MTSRRLLFGDWHPWLRDPIDLLRALLLLAAAAFAAAGEWRGAGLLAGAGVVAWLVRLVWLPRVYDLCIVLALALQAGGEALRLYDSVLWFDNLVHFSLPFFGGPTLYVVLARLDVVPDPKDETHLRHYIGIAIVAFALGVSLGALWELVEWASDRTLGSLFGAALLACWARWGWGSVRRIPGENRREDAEAG